MASAAPPPPLDPSEAATIALVAFLRAEADASEQKAKSLRAQADHLSALYAITDDIQERYELGPDELPPLDENGVPKYRGKKRGRKPRERKRKANPERRKRQHTAYTLFVQERYPGIKSANPGFPSKDLISMLAKMWAQVPAEEKRGWKDRAIATHDDEDEEEEDDDEVDEEDGDNGNNEEQEEQEEEEEDKGGGGGENLDLDSGEAAFDDEDEEDVSGGHNHEDLAAPTTGNTRRRRR